MTPLLEALSEITELPLGGLYAILLVVARVSAFASVLPGFGEFSLPMRVRLAAGLALGTIVYPMVAPTLPRLPDDLGALLPLILSEITIGLAFGLAVRFTVQALQLAGSIAGQSTSLAQIMGATATPDPMPAIGNILLMAGLALALTAGLHVKAAIAVADTFRIVPLGGLPDAADMAAFGLERAASAFALAFTLAAPFVIASFAYNLVLGVINRAMPQLLVAFIGAPAITAAAILILFLAGPIILTTWLAALDAVMAEPLGALR